MDKMLNRKWLLISVILILIVSILGCVAQPSTEQNQTLITQNKTVSNISTGQPTSPGTTESELPPFPPEG